MPAFDIARDEKALGMAALQRFPALYHVKVCFKVIF